MNAGNGHANGSGGGDRLDSWKAIAAYLGRDAGTVRRWERTRGLPAHRVPGGKRGSVFAFTTEIDAWLQSAPQETPAQLAAAGALVPPAAAAWWRWPVIAAAVAATIVVAWWVQPSPAASAADLRIQMTEQALTALNAAGEPLWVYRYGDQFHHPLSAVSERSRVVAGDEPAVYFTTSHRQGRAVDEVESGEFTALTLRGERRWTFRFDDRVGFGTTTFGPPWAMTAFAVNDLAGGPRRLAVAAHHWTWGPSLVAILDDAGRRLGTFGHDGWIEQLKWLSRDRLALGGFSESRNGGLVAVIDPSRLDGRAPEEAGSKHECTSCGAGLPLRMAVMPRSEINRATHSRFNRAILEWTGDRLIARTVEVPPQGQGVADAIYEFTPDLTLVRASFSERYWEIHDQLEAERKLDHGRSTCPDKDGPRQAFLWSPDSGWTSLLPGEPGPQLQ